MPEISTLRYLSDDHHYPSALLRPTALMAAPLPSSLAVLYARTVGWELLQAEPVPFFDGTFSAFVNYVPKLGGSRT
jgi:hypothetical protein